MVLQRTVVYKVEISNLPCTSANKAFLPNFPITSLVSLLPYYTVPFPLLQPTELMLISSARQPLHQVHIVCLLCFLLQFIGQSFHFSLCRLSYKRKAELWDCNVEQTVKSVGYVAFRWGEFDSIWWCLDEYF